MRNRLTQALAPLATVALLIALAAHYIRIAADHDYFYNADLLYLPSLLADVARGGDLYHWRFSNAPYIFPDIGLFLLLEILTPNSLIAIALYGMAQTLLLVGGFAWLARRTAGGGPAPALALACLDAHAPRYGLRAGLAQYWQAHPIMFFSRQGLHAAQIDAWLQPWHWLNNLEWYGHDFDFAVVDSSPLGQMYGFTTRALVTEFGPPAARFNCGDSSVFVYNCPSDYHFRNFARVATLQTQLKAPGNAVHIPPALLARPAGKAGASTLEAAPGAQEQVALRAPISLRPGRYSIRLRYSSDAPDEAGFVELSAQGRAGEIELTNVLPLASGQRAATVQFSLQESAPITIQLFSSGRGRLALDQITLTRLN